MAEREPADKKKVTVEVSREGVKGKITLDDKVAATIAGMAARSVKGIHQVGRSSLISFGGNVARGVAAEIGKIQAAFDIDIILEYGYDIKKVASELRGRIAEEVSKMTGREVVEININVVDIKLPEDKEPEEPRVL